MMLSTAMLGAGVNPRLGFQANPTSCTLSGAWGRRSSCKDRMVISYMAGIHSPKALLRSLSHLLSYSLTVLQGFLKVYWAKYILFGLDRRGQKTHCDGLWWLNLLMALFCLSSSCLNHFAVVLGCQTSFLHNSQLTSATCKVSPSSVT